MSDLSDSTAPLYYRHTGQAPFIATTFATIASWIVVTILAVAYGYADLNFKWYDIISVGILFASAAAMALCVYGIIRSANVRSIPVTIIISGSSALLALYVSWVAWEYFLLRSSADVEFLELFRRPDAVWDTARVINGEGTWGLRSGPVKGVFLWFVWLAEALMIVGITGGLPPQMLKNLSFCENCRRWCPKPKGIIRLEHGDEAMLKTHMEQRNFAYLAAQPRAGYDTPLHFHVELCQCGTCDETNLLTVGRVSVGRDGKGNRQESTVKIVNRLHVSADEAEEIKALSTIAAEESTPAATPPATPSA